jgi:hypothetical protein
VTYKKNEKNDADGGINRRMIQCLGTSDENKREDGMTKTVNCPIGGVEKTASG